MVAVKFVVFNSAIDAAIQNLHPASKPIDMGFEIDELSKKFVTDYRTSKSEEIKPFFSRLLPDDLELSIIGRVGHWGSQKVACVSRLFRATVKKARELRMYGVQELSIDAGVNHTVISTMGRVYTCGGRANDEHENENDRAYLGHSGEEIEHVPRLVEALVGVNVVGTAAGFFYTVLWMDEGEAYSFGVGGWCMPEYGANN